MENISGAMNAMWMSPAVGLCPLLQTQVCGSSCKQDQFHSFLSLPQATPFLPIPSLQQQHLGSHMMTQVRLVWLKAIHFLNTNNKNRVISHWFNPQHQHWEGIRALPPEVGVTSSFPSLTHQWNHWGTAALIPCSYKKDSKSAQRCFELICSSNP